MRIHIHLHRDEIQPGHLLASALTGGISPITAHWASIFHSSHVIQPRRFVTFLEHISPIGIMRCRILKGEQKMSPFLESHRPRMSSIVCLGRITEFPERAKWSVQKDRDKMLVCKNGLRAIGLFRLERRKLCSVLFSNMGRVKMALFSKYWRLGIRTLPCPTLWNLKEAKCYLERRGRERVGLGNY